VWCGAQLDLKPDKWRRSARTGVELPLDIPISIFDYDEEEIARQLTIREFTLYREIKSPELLNQVRRTSESVSSFTKALNFLFTQAWNKEKLHPKAFNVLQMIKKFNEASMWVVSLILEPTKVKHRAKRWEALVKIANVRSY